MRSNVAWIGLSLFSLLGAGVFTACGGTTNREVGSVYPVTGERCSQPGQKAAAADGCNECTCGDDGTWSCTDAACTTGTPDGGAAGNPPPPAPCKEGDTKKARCNTCTCTGDGQWSCTDMACNPQCEPGRAEATPASCNGCKCDAEGFWDCWTDDACEEAPCWPGNFGYFGCLACTCIASGEIHCDSTACDEYPE